MKFGLHVSIGDSLAKSVDRALERGCDTFQIFTRNPRGWKYSKLKKDETAEFINRVEKAKIDPIVAHMPYLPNISCPKKALYNKSVKSLTAELERCVQLRVQYLVTHLGSHLGMGSQIGIKQLANAVNSSLREVSGNVRLLLENTAGQRNSVGSRFEEMKRIVDNIEDRTRLGICFDTCHAFAAGYDLRSANFVKATMSEFERILGLGLLKVVHVNDSKGGLGSGLDRHEHIGTGQIGEKGFRDFFHYEPIKDRPFILETPIDDTRNEFADLRKARELASRSSLLG